MKSKNIVLITGPGFEDPEVIYPYYRMLEEGWRIDVVTSSDQGVTGKKGWPILPTVKIESLSKATYDAVIIPGGHEAPDRVRQVGPVIEFIKKMNQDRKVISSTCHGPWVLIEAGILRGKHATCYPGMKTDVINAGALYEAKPVVVDGNIVTSDHPRNLGVWMKETIRVMNAS